MPSLSHKREVIGQYALVRLAQQALQAQQQGANVVNGAPLVLEDVEADAPAEVDVGVVDGRLEEHGGRAVGVVVCELHGQLEDEARVGCVGGAVDGGRPQGDVGVGREGGDAGCGLHHGVHELLLETGSEELVIAGCVEGWGGGSG